MHICPRTNPGYVQMIELHQHFSRAAQFTIFFEKFLDMVEIQAQMNCDATC